MKTDAVQKNPAPTNKWKNGVEVGSLVLGVVLTSLQIFFTVKDNRPTKA